MPFHLFRLSVEHKTRAPRITPRRRKPLIIPNWLTSIAISIQRIPCLSRSLSLLPGEVLTFFHPGSPNLHSSCMDRQRAFYSSVLFSSAIHRIPGDSPHPSGNAPAWFLFIFTSSDNALKFLKPLQIQFFRKEQKNLSHSRMLLLGGQSRDSDQKSSSNDS